MQSFILREKIANYRRTLQTTTDAKACASLKAMLDEAEEELKASERIWTWSCPHLALDDATGEALEAVLDRVVSDHGARYGTLQIWDDGSRALLLVAQCNFRKAFVDEVVRVVPGAGTVCALALEARKRVVIEDVETEPAIRALREWFRFAGIKAVQSTPIFAPSGEFAGVFSTHFSETRRFSDEDHANSDRHAASAGALIAAHRARQG